LLTENATYSLSEFTFSPIPGFIGEKEYSMSTRRNFLGTLGKAFGAGALLLPAAGSGALALPADLGRAASLPVTPVALPVSVEMLRLREIRQELHSIYLATPDDYPQQDHPDEFGTRDGRSKAWREVMRNQHEPTAQRIIGRKDPTWSDCAEIAEIALQRMYRLGPQEKNDITHKLVWAVLRASGKRWIFIPEIGDFEVNEGEDMRAFARFRRF
jgi:hypothetical protein